MKQLLLAVVALPLLVFAGDVAADAKKCPISGKDANQDISLLVNGQKVAFCCKNCFKAYQTTAFINVAKKDAPGKCPITGKDAKAECQAIKKTAKLVNFCCGNCPKAFAKKGGFEPKDDGPKKCPLSGNPAKDEAGTSLVVNGKKTYFCCKNCPKAYLKKLGINPDQKVTVCPVSKNPGKAEHSFVVVESEAVNFCCGNCRKKYIETNFKDGLFTGGKGGEKAKPKAKKRLKL